MMITLKNSVKGNPITINTDDISSVEPLQVPDLPTRSVVWMRSGAKFYVCQPYEEVVRLANDRSHEEHSSWVVLAMRVGAATTIFLPGIGEVVAFGDDKRNIAFRSWHEAMASADVACEVYACMTEVARIDLVLGVDH